MRWIPIPPLFHSLLLDGPFTNCVDCNCDLLEGSVVYGIERVFRGTEPIMEMAICTNCRDKISEELSQESLMRINAYVDERCDWEQRFDDAKEWEATDLQQWLDKCVLLKTPASECQEYQIAAVCRGDLMSIDLLPILISGAASEEMQKLMSKKTRDRLGEMVDDFFGMPSEFVDSPQSYSPTIW